MTSLSSAITDTMAFISHDAPLADHARDSRNQESAAQRSNLIERHRQTQPFSRLVRQSVGHDQYNEDAAAFFQLFNEYTSRPKLYFGFIAGAHYMSKNEKPASERKIAVDFGCGTGWLTQKLPTLGYTDVYGIDLSPAMIKKAFFGTPQHLVSEGTVVYSNELPREIVGKCDLVTAVQVHYHFVPFEQLKNDFFGKISSYLRPNGQAVIIGCPSDFVHDTPDHYQNCVHIDDVPPEVLSKATRPDLLADEDGFIALSCLPKYKLEDGTQMKVSFSAYDKNNKMHVHTLFDTFWSDQTMIKTASKMGLDLLHHETLAWDNYPNAYMAMLFKKRPSSTPVSCCLA